MPGSDDATARLVDVDEHRLLDSWKFGKQLSSPTSSISLPFSSPAASMSVPFRAHLLHVGALQRFDQAFSLLNCSLIAVFSFEFSEFALLISGLMTLRPDQTSEEDMFSNSGSTPALDRVRTLLFLPPRPLYFPFFSFCSHAGITTVTY